MLIAVSILLSLIYYFYFDLIDSLPLFFQLVICHVFLNTIQPKQECDMPCGSVVKYIMLDYKK